MYRDRSIVFFWKWERGSDRKNSWEIKVYLEENQAAFQNLVAKQEAVDLKIFKKKQYDDNIES